MKKRNKILWTVLFCLYLAAVAYLCFMRPDKLPEIKPDLWGIPIDKVAHFIMFFPYPIVAYGAFMPSGSRKILRIAILALLFAAGIGLAMGTEKLQGLSEFRTYDIKDFYADIIGMGAATVVLFIHILTKRN